MNLESMRLKLLAAARYERASQAVPYAFEKRIMSRLAGRAVPDVWAAWAASLWRAVGPCLAVLLMVALGTWVWNPPAEDLHEQLDAVLLADLESGPDAP